MTEANEKKTLTLELEGRQLAVTLGQYRGLSAHKEAPVTTDAEVEAEVDRLMEHAVRKTSVPGPAAMGHVVRIDYAGSVGEEFFRGGTAQDQELELGSHSFIPGFEEGVVGMNVGEEKDIPVTFPEDYYPELAGKAANFHVKLLDVQKKEPMEKGDEAAKAVSGLPTLEALREAIRGQIQSSKDEESRVEYENAVMEKATANLEVALPEELIAQQTERLLKDMEQRMQAQGITLDLLQSMTGKDAEAMKAEFRPTAEQQLRCEVLLRAVAQLEGLSAESAEADAEYRAMAAQYRMPEEKVRELVPLEELLGGLTVRKAADLVLSTAQAE